MEMRKSNVIKNFNMGLYVKVSGLHNVFNLQFNNIFEGDLMAITCRP